VRIEGVDFEEWTAGRVVRMGGLDDHDCKEGEQGSEGVWKPGFLLFGIFLRTRGVSGSWLAACTLFKSWGG
jgi:hypothetical protein